MSFYEVPTRRRSSRRSGVVALAALIVVALAALIVVGAFVGFRDLLPIVRGSAPTSVTSDPASANAWLLSPEDEQTRAACIDPTGSSSASFAEGMRGAIADAVAGWAGPRESQRELPARPALHLILRTVSTHSGATEGQVVLDRVVPAVDGLREAPQIGTPDYASTREGWTKAKSQRDVAWQAANGEATEVAAAVRALRLERDTNSAISGCLAAAAESSPADASRRLLLATDGLENEPAVVGAYGGSPVTLIISCPAGRETFCTSVTDEWRSRLVAQGAGEVVPIRADAAASAIEDWMG